MSGKNETSEKIKPRGHMTLQEELVHGFSKNILGSKALFYPSHYGHSREPADIAWVTNRCAILMYVTEGARSYSKKCNHNIRQFRKWVRKWKSGTALCGYTNDTKHEFNFSDVDHVIGISIVDGGDSFCEFHRAEVTEVSAQTYKISACATLSSDIMKSIAGNGLGPRDLLSILTLLQSEPGAHPQSRLIEALAGATKNGGEALLREFPNQDLVDSYFLHAIHETREMLNFIKNISDDAALLSIGADLKSSDAQWLVAAYAFLESQIKDPATGKFGYHFYAGDAGIYRLQILIAFNSKTLMERMHLISDKAPGIAFITDLEKGRRYPLRSTVVVPRLGPSMLEKQAEDLRIACIAPLQSGSTSATH